MIESGNNPAPPKRKGSPDPSGCFAVCMLLIGILLLLPGLCALWSTSFVFGQQYDATLILLYLAGLLAGLGGILLIWAASRSRSKPAP